MLNDSELMKHYSLYCAGGRSVVTSLTLHNRAITAGIQVIICSDTLFFDQPVRAVKRTCHTF